MHYRPNLLTVPIILLCLGAISVSLSGSRKAQRVIPAKAISNSDRQVSVATTTQAPPSGSLVDPFDLQALTRDADLIVIGRVSSVQAQGHAIRNGESDATEAEHMVAVLRVSGVVKGAADMPTLSFEFPITRRPSGYRSIETSHSAMFFLRKNAERGYAVLNPYYPFVIVSSNPIIAGVNDLDRVVGVIGRNLTEPTSSVNERRLAVNVLDSARTDLATRILRLATKDKDAVVRLQALSALLNRNDISLLDMAENTLLHPPPSIDPDLLWKLSAALEGIKDQQAIPTLKRLLISPNDHTRLGAAMALRQMRVSDAIDGLVVALEDNLRDVRYEAVIGLAETTGQYEWGPSIDLFQRDERYYLAHWREWAKNR